MAWTFTTLKTAIADYVMDDEPESQFVTNLPLIIMQAEDRILQTVPALPAFRKNCVGSLTGNDQYLGVPADFLAPYSLSVDNNLAGGYQNFLMFKDVSFIRSAYPSTSTTGEPKYYAIFNEGFFIVAPTPNTNYSVEIHYFYKPESITTAQSGTSWLGTHATSALFYGCLVEAYTFVKGDADIVQLVNGRYDQAMVALMALADPKNRTDEYRNG